MTSPDDATRAAPLRSSAPELRPNNSNSPSSSAGITQPTSPTEREDTFVPQSPPVGDTDGTLVRLSPPVLPRRGAAPDVPGYAIVREIARGGMGVVYFANDPVFDREVAVKVMHHGQDADRFVVESRVTAQLPHPGIPPVYALGGTADGRPFLAMKLIQGRTFSDELNASDRAADLPRLLGVFERICETVGFAHARGIVHRDLKPQNVMVGSFGEVLVLDWGLARTVKDEGRRMKDEPAEVAGSNSSFILRPSSLEETRAGQVKGTPAYMAPEQARGESVGVRADVFALGGILAAILTGKAPFSGTTVVETITRAAAAELDGCFERLGSCNADAELVAVAKRCLAPNADERFADGAAVATAVAAYRAGVEERLREAERERAVNAAEAREQRKRRKVQMTAAVTIGILLAAGVAVAWYADRQASERRQARERLELEQALKGEQAREAVRAGRALAADLRKQYRFASAAAALAQAAALARGGAPELLPEVERAQSDLALATRLDAIRYRKWSVSDLAARDGAGEGKRRLRQTVSTEYPQAFAAHGLDVLALDPTEAAARVAASEVKAELVAALDDWSTFDPDRERRRRLLAIARKADPGPWTDRFRDPAVRDDPKSVAALVADPAALDAGPAALAVLAGLANERDVDPSALLAAARLRYPSDYDLAFFAFKIRGWRNELEQAGGLIETAIALRPDSAFAWNSHAVLMQKRGDLVGALPAIRRAIELDPGAALLHYHLGLILQTGGDQKRALAAFDEALRLDPTFPPAHMTRATALAALGDRPGGIAALRESVRHDPAYGKGWNNLASALLAAGDLNGALAATNEAQKLIPEEPVSIYTLGQVLYRKGDKKGAAEAYRRALQFAPNYYEAHQQLGVALQSLGDFDGATAEYREAIRSDPVRYESRVNLAYVLLGRKDIDGALTELRVVLRLEPKLAIAHRLTAQALALKGDEEGMFTVWREYARLSPTDADAHYKLGQLLTNRGDKEGALAAFRTAVKSDPKMVIAFLQMGGSLLSRNDPAGAATAYREYLKFNPADATTHSNLGAALQRAGDLDGALAAFREAVKHNPKLASAHFNIGVVLMNRDPNGALAALQEAIEHEPGMAAAHVNIAAVYRGQKKPAAAVAAARAAVRSDPKMPQAHAVLGLSLLDSGDTDGARAALAEAARLDPKQYGSLPATVPPPVAPPPRAVNR